MNEKEDLNTRVTQDSLTTPIRDFQSGIKFANWKSIHISFSDKEVI